MKKFTLLASVVCLLGCNTPPETGKSTVTEMEQTEVNQLRLAKAYPPPQLKNSLERANLIARLERVNQTDLISYIYLINYGKVMAHYTVKGKVSSMNSLLTTPTQATALPRSGGGYEYHLLPSPDFDGSYGKNDDGIFFFTTDGAFVEWKGDYLWADRPLKLTQPPELIMSVEEKAK